MNRILVLRRLSATILVGAVTGAVIGGVGGRLAMRLLFLTSDDAVNGLESDDGFEIGRFSMADTVGLIAFTAVLGVIAALVYFAAHPLVELLPARARAVSAALFYGVVGGAFIVHRDGVDFRLLEPVWLAVLLFVAIGAGFGAVIGRILPGALADDGWPAARSWWLLGPPLVVLVFPPALVAAAVAVGVHTAVSAARAADRVGLVARPITTLALTAVFVVACADLVRDAAALV